MSHRRSSYKNFGKNDAGLRKRRNEELDDRRKERKDQFLAKRRHLETVTEDAMANEENATVQSEKNTDSDSSIEQILADINQEDDALKLRGLQLANRLANTGLYSFNEISISSAIINKCVEVLKMKNKPDLHFEAVWLIANTSVVNSEVILNSGAIQCLINMLKSPNSGGNLVEQICWTLGNCIVGGPQIRSAIFEMGVIPPLVGLIELHAHHINVLRRLAWTLSKIYCWSDILPTFTSTLYCVPALVRLLAMEDREVLTNTCQAFSNLCEGSYDKIQDVFRAGAIPRLTELLSNEDLDIVFPCLRAIGNITAGTHFQVQAVIRSGVIPRLMTLLQSGNSKVIEDAAWVLSNIAAGNLHQVTALMDSGAIPLILYIIEMGDFNAQTEAIWIVRNITNGGFMTHILTLYELGVVPMLCKFLLAPCSHTAIIVLEGLENILKASGQYGQLELVKITLEECGGLDKIEQLYFDKTNDCVSNKAKTIIENYFDKKTTPNREGSVAQDVGMEMDVKFGGFNL